ncbi:MAG: APC family permease [Microcella pacifica]|uniref:APC family permease n=1 Tax=Microcella pacifica TaxID=2591847 RepID=A0A9E5ML33_9MICO|nr:APC family permease [Microcella pacifica]NHF63421.1 APC family permease [Microcella pacifica]
MTRDDQRISLIGSVSLGTGVMIGAGIFALVGQVAEISGAVFPWVFLAAAVVVGLSSHAYARYSAVNPTSGGIAMLLRAAYGNGVVAGAFSLFMYVSMVVAESLIARTFGTYLLQPFGLQDSVILVPLLGVLLIAATAIANIVGNRFVERSATATAVIKIVGIATLAIAGIIGTVVASGGGASSSGETTGGEGGGGATSDAGLLGIVAGVALCVLAYKGFTTITNHGAELRDPKKNLPRSIVLAIAICAGLYALITVAVAANLTVPEIVEARDFALARAADPLFGQAGVALTVGIAVIATASALLANLFSVSRLFAMLQDMGQAPRGSRWKEQQPLLITAGLAIVVTVLFDLGQIASLGVFLYLTMDIAVQWGVLRRLRGDTGAHAWPLVATIVFDGIILGAFTIVTIGRDPLTLLVASVIGAVLFLSQWLVVRHARAE